MPLPALSKMVRRAALFAVIVSSPALATAAEWHHDLDPELRAGTAERVAALHLAAHRESLRLDGVHLAPVRALGAAGHETVRLEQVHRGLPVVGGQAAVRVSSVGQVTVTVLDVHRGLSVGPEPVVAELTAVEIARRRAGGSAARARLSVLPALRPGGALVWQVDLPSAVGGRRILVDALDGGVVSDRPLAIHAVGRVYPQSLVATPDLVDVELVDLVPSAPQTLNGWSGHLSVVNHQSGTLDSGELTFAQVLGPSAGEDFLYDPPVDPTDPGDAFAQVSTYYHATRMRDFFAGTLGVDMTSPTWKLVAAANLRDGEMPLDNAFFSPGGAGPPWNAPNLIGMGQGTSFDFSDDADVINHELSHYVTYNAIGYNAGKSHVDTYGRSPFSAAIDEGLSDYFACSVNGDGLLGEGSLGLLGKARDLNDTAKRCPLDMHGEVHDDGEIIGSFAWTLRSELGREVADDLVWGAASLLTFGASFGDFGRAILEIADERVLSGTLSTDERAWIEARLEDRGLHECDPEIPLRPGELRGETLHGYDDCQQARSKGRTRHSMFHYVVTPDEGAAGIAVDVEVDAGNPVGLRWGIYARAGEHVTFVPEFPVDLDAYDFATEGITEAEGRLVIDAESEPPFDPAYTYHFVLVHTNCTDAYALLSVKSLPPSPPGAGGGGGGGEGGAAAAPPEEGVGGGCGCRSAGEGRPGTWAWAVVLAAALQRRGGIRRDRSGTSRLRAGRIG